MPTDRFTALVLDPIAEVLVPYGFRRAGSVFRRDVDDVIHLVALQRSVASTASTKRVTINVGVWIRSLGDGGERPNAHSAQWRKRIGHFCSPAEDRWWSVESESQAQEVGRSIAAILTANVLPVLAGLSDSPSIAKLWEDGESPGLTAMQAERYLKKLKDKKRGEPGATDNPDSADFQAEKSSSN